jgi:hypothetical protein
MPLNINIFGSYDARDQDAPVASVGEDRIARTLNAFAAQENARLRDLLSFIVDFGDTSVVTEDYGLASGGVLQPMNEFGPPEATLDRGEWSVGYPIFVYGDRSMYTPWYLENTSVANLGKDVVRKTIKDYRTNFVEVLKAVLYQENYTFNDKNFPGSGGSSFTVRRLANADGAAGAIYPAGLGEITLAALNHYKISGNAAVTQSAYELARDTLRAAGLDGSIQFLVSPTTASASTGFAGWRDTPDPLITGQTGEFAILNGPRAVGRIADGQVNALPGFPDGYLFAWDASADPPVKARETASSGWRGWRLALDETRFSYNPGRPLVNRVWQRIVGYGVKNRVNGVSVKFTAGAYTNPVLA